MNLDLEDLPKKVTILFAIFCILSCITNMISNGSCPSKDDKTTPSGTCKTFRIIDSISCLICCILCILSTILALKKTFS